MCISKLLSPTSEQHNGFWEEAGLENTKDIKSLHDKGPRAAVLNPQTKRSRDNPLILNRVG